jgi:thioredoxin-like negative regulator of GroEL
MVAIKLFKQKTIYNDMKELITLNNENVLATLKKSTKEDVIVVYTTTNCASCKALKITLDKMLNTGDITEQDVYLFNMDGEKDMNYGVDLGIRGIPCLIKYTNGDETARAVGSKSPLDIKTLLSQKEKLEK